MFNELWINLSSYKYWYIGSCLLYLILYCNWQFREKMTLAYHLMSPPFICDGYSYMFQEQIRYVDVPTTGAHSSWDIKRHLHKKAWNKMKRYEIWKTTTINVGYYTFRICYVYFLIFLIFRISHEYAHSFVGSLKVSLYSTWFISLQQQTFPLGVPNSVNYLDHTPQL